MPRSKKHRRSSSENGAWVVRCLVFGTLALTLWLAGPTAWRKVAARIQTRKAEGPPVELDRVAIDAGPSWLRGDLLLAVMSELEPRLQGRAALLDEVAAQALRARLVTSPWVREVELRHVYPDRFGLSLTLRRPVLLVCEEGSGETVALVDRDGIALPPIQGLELPRTLLGGGWRPGSQRPVRIGQRHPDPAVRAAAEVAVEWAESIAPSVPDAPRLLEVDGRNVDYGLLADGRQPEVQVVLEREDGEWVSLAYGHHPSSRYERLDAEVKVQILAKILAAHPGLRGLTGGDLRFANRWEQYIRPYRGADPWGDPDH